MKSETVTFKVECTMKKRWVNHFFSMLKDMERLGGLGGSRTLCLYSDGDGDFRPKFEFSELPDETKIVPPHKEYSDGSLYDAG